MDVSLFPLDAIKTRLQSQAGFWQSGGFSRPYAGITATMAQSIPSAALFFAGYESTKYIMSNLSKNTGDKEAIPKFIIHMTAASVGEVFACLVRVPAEVLKQRTQAKKAATVRIAFRNTLATDGILGLYRGFGATLARDIPFAFIQFPIWEMLKVCIL